MRKILLIIALFALQINMNAEIIKTKISLTPSYAEDLYFNLVTGEYKTAPNTDWDIAFTYKSIGGAWINDAKGVKAYQLNNYLVNDIGTAIDTAGVWQYPTPLNSADNWLIGSLNMGQFGYDIGDFGWGEYNPVNHNIVGKALYVVTAKSGISYQLAIETASPTEIIFSVANLDGSNKQTITKNRGESSANMIYFNFDSMSLVEREPSNGWHLLFGKYIEMVSQGNVTVPYPLTGVRTNYGLETAEVKNVSNDEAKAPKIGNDAYTSKITEIGADWKVFSGGMFSIMPNWTYFVTDNTNIYKVFFNSFAGSSTGEIEFSYEAVVASVIEEDGFSAKVAIESNVIEAGQALNFITDANETYANLNIALYDLVGNKVSSYNMNIVSGINQLSIPTEMLSSGIYFLNVQTASNNTMLKFIVK